MTTIELYDTTLRDGMQQEGLSLSVEDKLRIARCLDRFGIDRIEGGWPGSNPKDAVFFRRAAELDLQNARLSAFGSTCRAGTKASEDRQLLAVLNAGTQDVTIFGKAWMLHVREVLRTTPNENLRMIGDSIRFLRDEGRRVVYDAEHFFDGFHDDPAYALATIGEAVRAGAETAVLCDTNGGALPWQIEAAVAAVLDRWNVRVGIHTHDDAGLAAANALAAVRAGATHVHGTMNGYGERCGNADWCSILPTLILKMGVACSAAAALGDLVDLSATIGGIVNRRIDAQRPYVGRSAFAHKGGVHVDAMAKCPRSYQHIEPELVGNRRRVVVSELSGGANVSEKAREFGVELSAKAERTRRVLDRIKELEHRGFQFEGADASVELIVRRSDAEYRAPFELAGFHVLIREKDADSMMSEAAVKVRIGNETFHTVAEGNGPVNALDLAVRRALQPSYPAIGDVELTDYKVRILDGDAGTAARIRVAITSSDGRRTWSTVGCGPNVIEASWIALADALEYALIGIDAAQLASVKP